MPGSGEFTPELEEGALGFDGDALFRCAPESGESVGSGVPQAARDSARIAAMPTETAFFNNVILYAPS
uniref:Uncharacterized protein n=1 Tax=uncultured bacterium contig00154 TaxID=1181592 RepID=A0A806KNT4_9BACT|nr:hypothetical protein [uncultured bacterium contig00154]